MDESRQKSLTEVQQEYDSVIRNFRIAGSVALIVLIGGSVFYHLVEKLQWIDSFYFSTITLTTIGYGDIVPHTAAGKLFTMFYAIVGIGIIGTFANLLLKRTIVKRQLAQSKKRESK